MRPEQVNDLGAQALETALRTAADRISTQTLS
jgi:hypothetical protein